jgi:hypothetical protein
MFVSENAGRQAAIDGYERQRDYYHEQEKKEENRTEHVLLRRVGGICVVPRVARDWVVAAGSCCWGLLLPPGWGYWGL